MEIPLQNGMFALVDYDDFEKLSQRHWIISMGRDGYQRIFSNDKDGTTINITRFILDLNLNDGKYVYRKNGDVLDNRKSNLVVANREKWTSTRKGCKGASSKYKGVCWNKEKNKWSTGIKVNRVRKHLGYFIDQDEAAIVYNQYALKLFGKEAYQNIIGEDNRAQPLDFSPSTPKNQIRKNKKASSDYKGVDLNKQSGLWRARIIIQGKERYLGRFNYEAEASRAYNRASIELYGEKAILNKV